MVRAAGEVGQTEEARVQGAVDQGVEVGGTDAEEGHVETDGVEQTEQARGQTEHLQQGVRVD